MLLHQRHQAVINLIPHFVGSHWPKWHRRNFDCHIELALVADIDDDGIRPRVSRVTAPSEKMRNLLDWLLRSGESYPHGPPVGQRLQTFQRQRQMRATLVVGD